MLTNWIHNKNSKNKDILSLSDKIKILLKPHNAIRLVYVQKCELELLKNDNKKDRSHFYIDYLYNHYIVLNLPKTFLC